MARRKKLTRLHLRDCKVLVTGATGFLGGHILHILRERRILRVAKTDARIHLEQGMAAKRLVKTHRPDVIIHAAGWHPGMVEMRGNATFSIRENLDMGIRMMQAAADCGVRKFVLIGCASAYPANCPLPITEGDLWNGYPAGITAPYGVGKRMLGAMLQAYNADGAIPEAAYLILSDVYGPHMKMDCQKAGPVANIISSMVQCVREGRVRAHLEGSGTTTRDLLFARDAARGIVTAAEKVKSPEPINLSSGTSISMHALARRVAWMCKYQRAIIFKNNGSDEMTSRMISNQRALSCIGWSPQVKLKDGLRRTLHWYQKVRT